jgi:hypothetical protein
MRWISWPNEEGSEHLIKTLSLVIANPTQRERATGVFELPKVHTRVRYQLAGYLLDKLKFVY